MTGSNGRDLLSGTVASDTLNSGNGDETVSGGAGNNSLNGGAGRDTLVGGSGSDHLNEGSGSATLIFHVSENIGASPPVPCAMDIRPCRGPLPGSSDSPPASAMCRRGTRNPEQKMNDDFQVDPSEVAKRRIAYAAKVTELQYKQAKRICDEINGMPIGKDDPMVLVVLKAISTNYAAMGHLAELRICPCPEAAEIDIQTPRGTACGKPGHSR